MPRTSLMQVVRRAFHIAKQASNSSSTDKEEVVEQIYASGYSRRQFIGNTVKSAAVLGLGLPLLQSCAREEIKPGDTGVDFLSNRLIGCPKIVIVGAGVAGLNCAFTLRDVGIASTVYEASTRHGGRMNTAKNILAPGLTTEMGGEFIDSGHHHILKLAQRFGLNLIDTNDSQINGLTKDVFFFDNTSYTEADVINALLPIAATIQADIDTLPDTITAWNPGGATAFDNVSLEQYINNLNCVQWLKELLTVAYVTEYGLDAAEQCCINMLYLISVDTSNGFQIFGDSDERYKIEGGNHHIPNKLAKALCQQIEYDRKLVEVDLKNNGKYRLHFESSCAPTTTVNADIVVFALPFTLLREVTFNFPLPAWKTNAIQNLGYGTNAKVMAGFNTRYWQTFNKAGQVFTDESFQLGWDNSELQGGTAGGYTFYSGGTAGVTVGNGSAVSQYNNLITGLEKVYPGITAQHNGNVVRFHWPTFQYTKGSYACYKTGQYTTITGYERKPVDNLFFCGEHCSLSFQGYMNGGAETGEKAAKKILEKIGVTV
ncbi:MAG: FAD-dependent oxidoreductase [Bacteroidia bacterium]